MTTRRRFFTMTSVLAALPGSSAIAASASASPPAPSKSGVYDFAAIDARLARAARHKQVFATARIADGAALALMTHALDAYETTMGEGPGSLHPAAVVYARGVVLGLNDRMWDEYRIAEAARRRAEILTASGAGNPFGAGLASLTARGATVFVCDNALADWAAFLVAQMGANETTPDELRARLRRNLIPGAILVPAGVAALNAAQEARFTFVQASL